MSVNFTGDPISSPSSSSPSSEGSVFAAVPSWERNRKRRGFTGSSSAPPTQPLTAAEQIVVETRPPTGDGVFAAPPAYTSTARRPSGVAPLAIAAGIIALGGLAAAGWYAYQPHESGMAQLTPGSTSTLTTVTPAQPSVQIAVATPVPTAAPTRAVARSSTITSTTTTTRTATPQTTVTRHSTTTQVSTPVDRPAARSIEASSVNTAATAPALPAFKGLDPAAAPVETAPAPATAEVPTPPVISTPPQ